LVNFAFVCQNTPGLKDRLCPGDTVGRAIKKKDPPKGDRSSDPVQDSLPVWDLSRLRTVWPFRSFPQPAAGFCITEPQTFPEKSWKIFRKIPKKIALEKSF
jgi:hypothetical protein